MVRWQAALASFFREMGLTLWVLAFVFAMPAIFDSSDPDSDNRYLIRHAFVLVTVFVAGAALLCGILSLLLRTAKNGSAKE